MDRNADHVVDQVVDQHADEQGEQADVLLLTGLHQELQWIQRVSGLDFKRRMRNGTSYLCADITRGERSVRIVTQRQLEKGLTIAAVTATKGICIWRPKFVVMTGLCAGIRGAVDLGDLIVATQSFEHSSGQLINGLLVPAQNRVSIDAWLLDTLQSLTDSSSIIPDIQASYTAALPADTKTRIHYGSMACGPHVVKDKSYMDALKNREYSLLGLDMESYGVALAASMCSTHSHPVVPLIIKGVCDFADSEKSDLWHDYCSYASASFVLRLMEEVIMRDHAFSRIKGLAEH